VVAARAGDVAKPSTDAASGGWFSWLFSWRTLAVVQTLVLIAVAVMVATGTHGTDGAASVLPRPASWGFGTWWRGADAGTVPVASPVNGLQREIAALQEFARLRESLDADSLHLLHAAYLQRARSSDHLAMQLLDLNEQLRAVQHRLAEAAIVAAVAEAALKRAPAGEGAVASGSGATPPPSASDAPADKP
jgi:hypothetical protein